eukprot:12848445-Ditylum_brightwellii.AAC.1
MTPPPSKPRFQTSRLLARSTHHACLPELLFACWPMLRQMLTPMVIISPQNGHLLPQNPSLAPQKTALPHHGHTTITTPHISVNNTAGAQKQPCHWKHL